MRLTLRSRSWSVESSAATAVPYCLALPTTGFRPNAKIGRGHQAPGLFIFLRSAAAEREPDAQAGFARDRIAGGDVIALIHAASAAHVDCGRLNSVEAAIGRQAEVGRVLHES